MRSWPFLSLAAVTLLVGVAWHLSGMTRDNGTLGRAVFGFVSVLGAPFIGSMRLAGRLLGSSPARPIVALLLGLLPYLIADLLLRRRRATSAGRSAAG